MSVQSLELRAPSPVPMVVDGDARLFQENFNRSSFSFSHFLAGHPLFELPRLLELAKRQADGDVYYDAGDIPVDLRWDQTPRTNLSVDQLIDRIENAGAWILIRRATSIPGMMLCSSRLWRKFADLLVWPSQRKSRPPMRVCSSLLRTGSARTTSTASAITCSRSGRQSH